MLECLAPGLQATIQDGGRPGAAALGVPRSGACDPLAMAAANLLLGDPEDAPVLEMALVGPRFAVREACVAALAGADLDARVPEEGRRLRPGSSFVLHAGTSLAFGEALDGCRGYLALAGGIDVPNVLGSASTAPVGGIGGLGGRPLALGDRLAPRDGGASGPARRMWPGPGRASGVAVMEGPRWVRVVRGPHAEMEGEEPVRHLLETTWEVSAQSDRTGIRLEGPPVPVRSTGDLVSLGMVTGAVQLPPGGRPVVLLADGPTVGGYPVVAVAIGADWPVLGQLRPLDQVRFREVAMDEARAALARARDELAEAARRLAGQPAIAPPG